LRAERFRNWSVLHRKADQIPEAATDWARAAIVIRNRPKDMPDERLIFASVLADVSELRGHVLRQSGRKTDAMETFEEGGVDAGEKGTHAAGNSSRSTMFGVQKPSPPTRSGVLRRASATSSLDSRVAVTRRKETIATDGPECIRHGIPTPHDQSEMRCENRLTVRRTDCIRKGRGTVPHRQGNDLTRHSG
jgi:hypothetical protein